MKDEMLSRAWRVTDAGAAAVLADNRLRSLLLLFASEPRTLSEAADMSGMDLKRLHHHVRRIVAAGLLEVVGERPRAGRPMKLYRAVADTFFVSDELLPKPFMEGLARELAATLARHFQPGRGMLFGVGPDGEPRAIRVEEPDAPSNVVDLWFVVRLEVEHLRALKEEIRSLVHRYEIVSGDKAPLYLVHAAAAPKSPD